MYGASAVLYSRMFQNDTVHRPMLVRVGLLGLPLLFGQLMQYANQIADSAMLGHFGENSMELAAVGIGGMFTWILNTFLWPLSNGVSAITSRRFGRQNHQNEADRKATGEALDNAMVTALMAGLLAIAVSFLARPVLSLLIQTDEILELALQYIALMRFALIPSGLYFVMQGFFGAIHRTVYVMWSGILSSLANIALNYVFIFGHFGFPAMGIRGAALGTVLAQLGAFLFLLSIMIFRGYGRSYHLLKFTHLDARVQKDIVKVALNPAIQNIIALAIFMLYQTIVEDYSPVLLAATYTVFSYFRLNKTIIGGFARSAGIIVGNSLGRNDREGAVRAMNASGIIGASVALAIALLSFVFRGTVARLFTDDPATIEAMTTAMSFFVPFFFVEALGYSFEMVFVVNGYGRWVLFSEFSTNMLFILGATLLARYFFPGHIVYAWLSFGLYQLAHASLMIVGFLRRKWLDDRIERLPA